MINIESFVPEEINFFETNEYIEWYNASVQALLHGGPVQDFQGKVLITPIDFEIELEDCDGSAGELAETLVQSVEEKASWSFWKSRGY